MKKYVYRALPAYILAVGLIAAALIVRNGLVRVAKYLPYSIDVSATVHGDLDTHVNGYLDVGR